MRETWAQRETERDRERQRETEKERGEKIIPPGALGEPEGPPAG